MVLHVEKTCGLVGSFDLPAEPIEIPAFVPVEGAVGDPAVGLAGLFDHAAEAGQPRLTDVARREGSQPVVKHVELDPHLGRDPGAQAAGIFARHADRGANRARVGVVKQIEGDDIGRRGLLEALEEDLVVGIELDHRQPVLAAAAVPAEGLVNIENAGQILGALDVAGHPVRRLGIARQKAGHVLFPSPIMSYCSRAAGRLWQNFDNASGSHDDFAQRPVRRGGRGPAIDLVRCIGCRLFRDPDGEPRAGVAQPRNRRGRADPFGSAARLGATALNRRSIPGFRRRSSGLPERECSGLPCSRMRC